MKRKERLYKLVYDIYTQMFKEATPSVDYQWLLENAEEISKKPTWYLDYTLPSDRFEEIIEENIKANKLRLSKYERSSLS